MPEEFKSQYPSDYKLVLVLNDRTLRKRRRRQMMAYCEDTLAILSLLALYAVVYVGAVALGY